MISPIASNNAFDSFQLVVKDSAPTTSSPSVSTIHDSDKVTLSAAAQASIKTSDVDQDGDSH